MTTGEIWLVPGMMYPRWMHLSNGDFHNLEADTDMGDLDADEFRAFFPNARLVDGDPQ